MKMCGSFLFAAGVLCASMSSVSAEPLAIDLTKPRATVMEGHLGLGTTRRPDGTTLGADSQCLRRNGRPWMPVSGEFQFSRYPRDEWREELLKMKAGGIDVVATYLFWIHHEEKQGEFDWSGQRSLRDFLTLCQELGLEVMVRMGPWSHGECRNGGFPDWVQSSGVKLRTEDPEYFKLFLPYWTLAAKQMQGLLWKDGGPVIGVQLDNECGNLPYLFKLKETARTLGIDVPYYTMTGWQSDIPREGLMPLLGAYVDGFWERNKKDFYGAFEFRSIDMVGRANMGAKGVETGGERPVGRFPYLCAELGGGMVSSYNGLCRIASEDVAASALITLGSGNNMPGYYIYQGAVNPDGRYATLNEPGLPVKDYDFYAPLGACGQVRDHYHMLRQQHLFMRQFGETVATMQSVLPDRRPKDQNDVETMRWNARSNGDAAFLFFSNYHRWMTMPPKQNVQFSLKTASGTLVVPREPITIPTGTYGFWPVHVQFSGILVDYATAQPICTLDADGQDWLFFAEIPGIKPDFVVTEAEGQTRVQDVKPSTGVAFSRKAKGGRTVNFVVLPVEQARQLWRLPLAGRERVVLSPNAILPDSDGQIRLGAAADQIRTLAVFPPVASTAFDNVPLTAAEDGLFQRFTAAERGSPSIAIVAQNIKPADMTSGTSPNAIAESAWKDAAVWRLDVPKDLRDGRLLLRIDYLGDAARLYAGGKLMMDNYYKGQPFDAAYWRIPIESREDVEIHVLPLRKDRAAKMPEDIQQTTAGKMGAEIAKMEGITTTWTTVTLTGP